jgi:hypothetical protein
MIEIEKGVPVKGLVKSHYPFAQMDPNDSFFIACEAEISRKLAQSVASSARRFARMAGSSRRYATRRVEGGVRCWRVE